MFFGKTEIVDNFEYNTRKVLDSERVDKKDTILKELGFIRKDIKLIKNEMYSMRVSQTRLESHNDFIVKLYLKIKEPFFNLFNHVTGLLKMQPMTNTEPFPIIENEITFISSIGSIGSIGSLNSIYSEKSDKSIYSTKSENSES